MSLIDTPGINEARPDAAREKRTKTPTMKVAGLDVYLRDQQAINQEFTNVAKQMVAATQQMVTYASGKRPSGAPPPGTAPKPARPAGDMEGVNEALLRDTGPSGSDAREGRAFAMPTSFGEGTEVRLSDLRQGAMARGYEWASERTWGPTVEQDPETGQYRYDKGAVVNGENVGGRFVDAYTAGKVMRRTAVVNRVKSGVGLMAEGKGAGAALGQALPAAGKALGIAGMAYGAASTARDFMQNQSEANLAWQQALGGSNRMSAENFGERFESQRFEMMESWKGLWGGGMGADRAQKLYMGAANIYGTDRAARSRAVGFGTDAYRDFGMDIEQTLELVKIAAQSGNESLTGLHEALEGVSEAARHAGVNVGEAQKAFATNYAAAAQTLGPVQAVQMSGVLTRFQASLGQKFEGLDMSGLFGQEALAEIASREGYPEYNAALADWEGAGGTPKLAQGITNLVRQRTPDALRPEGVAILERWMRENEGKEMTPEDAQRLRTEMMDAGGIEDVRGLQAQLQDLMPGITANQAAEMTITAYAGPEAMGMTADAAKLEADTKTIGDPGKDERKTGEAAGEIAAALGMEKGEIEALFRDPLLWQGTGGRKGDTRRYINNYLETGIRDPAVEKLLKDGEYQSNRRYKVTTTDSDGKEFEKEVTLGEALDSYQNQIATGQVEITKGTGEGQTVSEVTGGYGDESRTKQEGESEGGEKLSTLEKIILAEKEKQEGEAESGRIVVMPTQRLSEWIDMQGTGAAQIIPPSGG